jgi:hypothetical protein
MDMLLSAVSVLVVAQSISEIPEGLMNNPVLLNLCVFVTLGIEHAKRMRRIVLSSVACPALQYFFHIISKTARYSKKRY